MLAIQQPPATVQDLMRLLEHDSLRAVPGRTSRLPADYAALLERVRLLEEENAVLQRQVQLFQELAVLD